MCVAGGDDNPGGGGHRASKRVSLKEAEHFAPYCIIPPKRGVKRQTKKTGFRPSTIKSPLLPKKNSGAHKKLLPVFKGRLVVREKMQMVVFEPSPGKGSTLGRVMQSSKNRLT